jgi:hypothetical protein
MTEHTLNAVALLVEDAVVADRLFAVGSSGNDRIDSALAQIVADGIGIVRFVAKQRGTFPLAAARSSSAIPLLVSSCARARSQGRS